MTNSHGSFRVFRLHERDPHFPKPCILSHLKLLKFDVTGLRLSDSRGC